MIKNKRGSFADIIYLAVFVFVIGLFITIGWMLNTSINSKWQEHDELGTESQEIMQKSNDRYVATWDGVFLLFLIGFYLASLVLAYNIDVNPLFFFLSLFLLGVIVVITGALGNAWYNYANNPMMASYVDDFVIIPFVMGHYVEIFVVMMFGLAGVMYAKTQ